MPGWRARFEKKKRFVRRGWISLFFMRDIDEGVGRGSLAIDIDDEGVLCEWLTPGVRVSNTSRRSGRDEERKGRNPPPTGVCGLGIVYICFSHVLIQPTSERASERLTYKLTCLNLPVTTYTASIVRACRESVSFIALVDYLDRFYVIQQLCKILNYHRSKRIWNSFYRRSSRL